MYIYITLFLISKEVNFIKKDRSNCIFNFTCVFFFGEEMVLAFNKMERYKCLKFLTNRWPKFMEWNLPPCSIISSSFQFRIFIFNGLNLESKFLV